MEIIPFIFISKPYESLVLEKYVPKSKRNAFLFHISYDCKPKSIHKIYTILGIKLKFKKVILWLPTFRNSKALNRNDSTFNFPLGIPIIYSKEDLNLINDYLNKLNVCLLLKLHPAQDTSVFKLDSLTNIIIINDKYLIDRNIELCELYKVTDAMITDYSSVYVDYLLLNKPLGFTQDDFEQYKKGFSMPNINDYMPGHKIMNVDDLKKFISDISSNIDNYKEERERVNKIFNKFNDSKSSERLAKYLDL